MMQFLDNLMIGFKCRAIKTAERFEEESGVSSFVATILLIVLVIAFAAIFWDSIHTWFTDIWAKITGGSNKVTDYMPK